MEISKQCQGGGGEGVQLWNFLILYCVNDKSSAAELDPLGGGGGGMPP